jgi:FkbM family methyltransferase
MRRHINRLVRAVTGYELTAHNLQRQHHLRKEALVRALGVTVVIDAGANRGQYAAALRASGYRGRIASIEPHPGAYAELTRRMAADPGWAGWNVALGAADGEADLFAPAVTEVSSLLPATGAGITGEWKTDRTVRVPVRRLDGLFGEMVRDGDVVYWKMDVQGFEGPALDGAAAVLPRVAALELEMSTTPLYAGEAVLPELMYRLHTAGFDLFSLDTVLVDYRTGRVLQVEGVFARRDEKGGRGAGAGPGDR